VQALGFWAKSAERYLADERVHYWGNPTVAGKKLVIRYEPAGVVGVIGPWNFPLVNGFGDCVPAMMAGNSVILKPSEVTPLSSLLMAEMFGECGLPEGVFQVATGDGSTGAALVAAVDCVMFTGSTRTGKLVARAAADALIPCHLELGGKDPMIVCADADIEKAANAAAYYSMNNAGQVCVSIERVYVEAPVHDEFVRRVTDKVKHLRQGPPAGPGTVDVGAVIFGPQLDVVDAHVRDAVAKGAKVLTGGHAHVNGGRFYEPTVLVDVDHTMEIMREETFGPTVPIMRVADVEEAVRLANDSVYGLQASVWTRDTARGEEIARRLESGVVCVNAAQVNYYALNLPMGGWKASGLSARHGAGGIRKYCRVQSLLVSGFGPRRELYMFPYRAGVTSMFTRLYRVMYGRRKRG
jgi:acyl-CoA reductase-like NAD-dependent aldehyde dehydrogenase